MSKKLELAQKIEATFADTPYPGDDNLVSNLTHYEADDVIRDFTGKHWREISLKVIYWHHNSLSLFTPEAFRFYLPAFLSTPLRAPFNSQYLPRQVLEFVFYSLMPVDEEARNIDRLAAIVGGFDSPQKAAITAFVAFFLETNPMHKQLYGQKANQFWQLS